MRIFSQWRGKTEDRFLVPQRGAILSWVKERGNPRPGETITFLLEAEEYSYLEQGRWRRLWREMPPETISFIVCREGVFEEKLKGLGPSLQSSDWHPLYRSDIVEVWERKSRHEGNILPLRFGLSDEEKLHFLRETRRLLGLVLANATDIHTTNLSERFDDIQTLDVAVWVKGRLRASVIVEGLPCREALAQAVRRVPRDGRFKPLEADELGQARIEITMMSDLHMPLSLAEYERNDIDATKGYRVRAGNKAGWYIPEVHNVTHFSSLKDLCIHLARDKAGLDLSSLDHRTFSTFAVFDWIENESHTTFIDLSGPTTQPKTRPVTEEEVRMLADRAVRQILGLIDAHGALPAVVEPGGGERNSADWTRIACVGHSLAVCGVKLGDQEASKGAQRIHDYLARYAPFDFLRGSTRWGALVYFLRLKLALGEKIDGRLFESIKHGLTHFRRNQILFLQGLTLLLESEQNGLGESRDTVFPLAESVFLQWRRDRVREQLALSPELVPIFSILETMTGGVVWRSRANEVMAWYKEQQLTDGSFPHSPGRLFAYTRGTGKIFEGWACFPVEDKSTMERIWCWLESMQYTAENTYHLRPQEREKFIGGFRHDAMNRELWIDASAHVILGAARWLASHDSKPNQAGVSESRQ